VESYESLPVSMSKRAAGSLAEGSPKVVLESVLLAVTNVR
jgi:hypothetical protein